MNGRNGWDKTGDRGRDGFLLYRKSLSRRRICPVTVARRPFFRQTKQNGPWKNIPFSLICFFCIFSCWSSRSASSNWKTKTNTFYSTTTVFWGCGVQGSMSNLLLPRTPQSAGSEGAESNRILTPVTCVSQRCSFYGTTHIFFMYFWRARVCWPLLCLCRPFIILEGYLNWNLESWRSKQRQYQLSHPSL